MPPYPIPLRRDVCAASMPLSMGQARSSVSHDALPRGIMHPVHKGMVSSTGALSQRKAWPRMVCFFVSTVTEFRRNHPLGFAYLFVAKK